MTKKERVKMALSHKEPDRVPLFELTVANPVLKSVLGKKITGFGTGEAKMAGIRAAMEGREARRAIIRENVEGMLEMYSKVGFDMFWFRPIMNEKVPGVRIPEHFIHQMEKTQDPVQTAIKITSSIINQMKGTCRGVHIMTLNWEDKVPMVLKAASF